MIDKKKTTSSATGEKPENPRPGSANKAKASIGPAIKDIKERFGEKKIPLDKDFADLIDIADSGRKAAGLSPEQTEDTDTGLRLLPTGQLAVKHDRELSVGENGLKVELWGEGGLNRGVDGKLLVGLQTDSGLVRNNVGIKVGAGNGITVSGDSVAVKLATTTPGLSSENGLKVELWGEGGLNYSADGKLLVGLQTNSGLVRNNVGIKVGAGNGITVSGNSVAVKLATTKPGLSSENGLKVELWGEGGLNYSSDGKLLVGQPTNSGLIRDNVGIKVGAGNGITVSGTNVAVKPGTGIAVDSNGVKVNLASIPKADRGAAFFQLFQPLIHVRVGGIGVTSTALENRIFFATGRYYLLATDEMMGPITFGGHGGGSGQTDLLVPYRADTTGATGVMVIRVSLADGAGYRFINHTSSVQGDTAYYQRTFSVDMVKTATVTRGGRAYRNQDIPTGRVIRSEFFLVVMKDDHQPIGRINVYVEVPW